MASALQELFGEDASFIERFRAQAQTPEGFENLRRLRQQRDPRARQFFESEQKQQFFSREKQLQQKSAERRAFFEDEQRRQFFAQERGLQEQEMSRGQVTGVEVGRPQFGAQAQLQVGTPQFGSPELVIGRPEFQPVDQAQRNRQLFASARSRRLAMLRPMLSTSPEDEGIN